MMPLRRLLLSAALMMATVLAGFIALILAGQITPLAGIVGFAAITAMQLALLRLFLGGLSALRRGIELIRQDPEGELPDLASASPAAVDLWQEVLGLVRVFRQRILRLDQALAGTDHVLAALPDPILLINDRREVVRVNAAATDLFGANLVARDLAVALRHPGVLAAADAVLKGGGRRVVEFDVSLPVDRHLRAQIEPLAESGGDGASVLLSMNDLTALKRAEQMRADFVANASHELRTPLSTLIGFIETLQGPAADDAEAQRRFLGIMQQQAARMARLVDDLLSLSRIELNEHVPPTDQVDLGDVIRNVAQALELKAAARGMRIDLALDGELDPVQGDAEELAQVFQNLIDNAIKYARPDSVITVTARPSPKLRPGIAIAVRDQSEGIPRPHLSRLTERFYRIDTARSRQLGGTGLGLAIVKHIVNRHRGALELHSTLGEGSVFTVHVRAASRARAGEQPRLRPNSAGLGAAR